MNVFCLSLSSKWMKSCRLGQFILALLLVLSQVVGGVQPISAATNRSNNISAEALRLADDVTALKKVMQQNLTTFEKRATMSKQPAEKISVDVTGWRDLSLSMSDPKAGGSEGVWGLATLTKKDGTTVNLSDIPFKSTQPRLAHMYPKRDEGWGSGSLVINGEVFEHGISMYAPNHFAVALNGEYTRFESFIGMEDSKVTNGSLLFTVKNQSGYAMVEDLVEKYPAEIGAIIGVGKINPNAWFVSNDGEVEKKAALTAAKSIKSAYYTARVEAVSGSVKERIAQYFSIITEIQHIADLSNRYEFFDLANVKRAFEDMSTSKSYDTARYEILMEELEGLATQKFDLTSGDKSVVERVEKILDLSRTILLSNSALDNNKIIFSHYKMGSAARTGGAELMGTQCNNWCNQFSSQRLGFDAEIAEMSYRGKTPEIKTIYKHEFTGPISDLMLHWDADRLLFTSINENKKFNIFEVGVDGEGVREIFQVDEPDLEFSDGTFLPSGKFIATSNLGYQAVPCVNGEDPVGNMVLYNPEDGDMRRLTFDQDANWHPTVANNGKVMYVRWEYTDLTHYFSRITMHMNPDGTEQKALYGSGDYFPNSTFDIKPLPGNTSSFIAIASGHHGVVRSGRLMLIDPAKSRKKVEGIVQEIPFSTREIEPIIKDRMVDGVWPQFVKPNPVSDKYFLVTAKLTPESLWGLYLVDIYDNMTLIMEAEGEGFISGIYAAKRVTPPVIPERVDLSSTESTVYIQDIYEGEGLPGVKRGEVKKLRVFAYEYGYQDIPSNHLAQGIQSGWDIKRLLGEVDVNEDGSTIFKIPANTPISLQPLDSEGRAMQWMRSWLTGMPGEVVSCIGCHEDQNMMPLAKFNLASKQTPQTIQEWDGGVRSFTFDLEIQPMLDRACIACHNESHERCFVSGIYDEGIKGNKFIHTDESPLPISYLNFHPYVNRQGPESNIYVMKPYEYHASTSEIVRMLKSGHHGVELTDDEWRKLYTWIDLNAPYRGFFIHKEFRGIDQVCRRQELTEKYANMKVDWQQEIEDYANHLKAKGEITPVKPDYVAPIYKDAKAKSWPFDADTAKQMQSELGETRMEVEIADGVKMVFRKVPSGEFVMGDNSYGKESAPETKAKIRKPFWIGEMEVSNEQFNALVPEHDSRYFAFMWKDQVQRGFPANEPAQPVIRVSYDEVMAYCEQLSEKLGMRVTLPTEAQWEWAARAGSDDAFWFGALGSDYAKYENMADVMLEKMVTSGGPTPMGKNNSMFKYLNYYPKDEEINDGSMVTVEGRRYESNAWGLYDMLGNVREWTSSDFIPYPYSEKQQQDADLKVVRGGSWFDRAKGSTTYIRNSAVKWQPLNTVGFRLVIEE